MRPYLLPAGAALIGSLMTSVAPAQSAPKGEDLQQTIRRIVREEVRAALREALGEHGAATAPKARVARPVTGDDEAAAKVSMEIDEIDAMVERLESALRTHGDKKADLGKVLHRLEERHGVIEDQGHRFEFHGPEGAHAIEFAEPIEIEIEGDGSHRFRMPNDLKFDGEVLLDGIGSAHKVFKVDGKQLELGGDRVKVFRLEDGKLIESGNAELLKNLKGLKFDFDGAKVDLDGAKILELVSPEGKATFEFEVDGKPVHGRAIKVEKQSGGEEACCEGSECPCCEEGKEGKAGREAEIHESEIIEIEVEPARPVAKPKQPKVRRIVV